VQGCGFVAHDLVERHAHCPAAGKRGGVRPAARDEFVAQRGERFGAGIDGFVALESASRTEAK
jgi:hypothetical protein